MPVSKQNQLVHARRQLRRLEEGAAAFRLRIADLPREHSEPMQRWFRGVVEQQRDLVHRLESVSTGRGRERRASAA
jgi:hypothetical protein